MKKNGYTVVELVVVLGVIGIFYFIVANNISYAFVVDYETEMYNQTIEAIETNAKIYAENHLDIFSAENDVYMKVSDLAKEDIILTDENGNVVDPRNEDKNLNDLKVKLTLKDDKVSVKVLV